ncbi:MAG: hypothetical protein KF861_01505 [Planctomycetaceae bacterium]|nr:hypothetical protein [Planctomycetaceae bacterium]
MSSRFPVTRIACGLLTAGLIALILGLPMLCLASGGPSSALLMTERAGVADGEAHGLVWEISGLFEILGDLVPLTLPAYADGVADDCEQWESLVFESHLQRGPPGC